MNWLAELQEIFALLRSDPQAAAERIDALAERLHAAAASLREGAMSGMKAPGGMGDRVKAHVVGPDGVVRQRIDTGLN